MHAPLYFYGGIDGLIRLGVLRDFAVSRRIPTVYLIAIPLLLVGQTAAARIFRTEHFSGCASLTD